MSVELERKTEGLENPPLPNWELREDGWYMLEKGSAVRVLPYFKIRKHYFVVNGDSVEEFVEIIDEEGETYIRKVKRDKRTYMPSVDLVARFGYINIYKMKLARRFLLDYIEWVKEKHGERIDFLGYKYVDGKWEIAVAGDKYTGKELSFIFYGKDLEDPLKWFFPSVEGNLETFKEIYKKLFSIDDPPLHFAIAHFLSWIAKEFLKGSSVVPNANHILIFVGDPGTGKTIRGGIATALYGSPSLFAFLGITLGGFKHPFPLLKIPFGIDDVFMHTKKYRTKFREFIYNIITHNPIEVPVLFTGETVALPIDKVFANFGELRRWAIVLRLTKQRKDTVDALDSAVEILHSHYGHILSYVKSLTEQDKQWIERIAKKLYEREELQPLEDAGLKDLRKHIALSLAAYAHFFLHFIHAGTDEEMDRKLAGIIDFVVGQITQNQVGRVGENIDFVEELMGFLSKVDEFTAKHKNMKLKGLSFKRICIMLNYTPTHKVEQLLQKFFWKRYSAKDENKKSTKLVFKPSCLISLPPLTFKGDKFDPSYPEVRYDKERLPTFTEEEARIWLEVFRRRHGDKWIPVLVKTFDLDKLPQFQKILTHLRKKSPSSVRWR